MQVMRAQGLGVVIEAGQGSVFKPGDRVTGGWGMSAHIVELPLMIDL